MQENVVLVCLRDVVVRHPVLGALAELPLGWRADLDFDVPEWVASPMEDDDEDE